MEVLWASPISLKPSQVLFQLKSKYAYTTIMTVLKRMSDKNIVQRTKQANSYVYTPTLTKEVFIQNCLDDLIDRLYWSYGSVVFDRFLSYLKNH